MSSEHDGSRPSSAPVTTAPDIGECRSCDLMGTPYEQQVREQSRELSTLLAPTVPPGAWLPPFVGPESGFRNKAKLAIGGTKEAPTFGILDSERRASICATAVSTSRPSRTP